MNSALTDWICAGNTSNENSPKMLMCLSIRSDCACNTQVWPLDCSHSDQKNATNRRSEEHTSELQSLMRISYAVFCLKKKKQDIINTIQQNDHHDQNKRQ